MMAQGGDPKEKEKEIMFTIMLETCKSQDRMWMQTGIDSEDLELAIKE